ncbi:hypothetical protein [Dyadobacter sp. CY343]|uniref:hypothetical protein n=1 Tax=Dyadobacter sp. CY343 TaxID=2907299 RepID=UPI001F322735|nr:hypothetical protein [Dyadobacter sp. CY343]MCE7063498.1 hypothetical protein [Dyadobacter sp. CY343]
MKRFIALLLFVVLIDACRKSDEIRPGEVEAVLVGFHDDTYNPCAGWIFDFGSHQRPALAVPEDFRNQKGLKVWVKYESDTTRSKIHACNFIKIGSIRKRR